MIHLPGGSGISKVRVAWNSVEIVLPTLIIDYVMPKLNLHERQSI